MVFESVVVDLVNRFLGDFITNLDPSQLSLSIWGGDVVLNGLFLREKLLSDFDLPFDIVFGSIDRIKLKIPWKNLYNDTTIAELDGLYVLAVPNIGMEYDEEKESNAQWESKQKELDRIERAKKQAELKDAVQSTKSDSFGEKLATAVVKNLEVKITNIHIRYEDKVTNPNNPFSTGVTLSELSLQKTKGSWCEAAVAEAANVIFKLATLSRLSVYLNCESKLMAGCNSTTILNGLKSTISSDVARPGFQYLIEPISATAQLQLSMKPEQENYQLPKVLAEVVFEQIAIVLYRNQIEELAKTLLQDSCGIETGVGQVLICWNPTFQLSMEFIEALQRMRVGERYRKYRPSVAKEGHWKQWWHFAYQAVLEEHIRRWRQMWSWQHISNHRRLCKRYKDLYKTKLLASKPTSDLLSQVEECERSLDVFNITLVRKQAEIEAKKEADRRKEKEKESSSSGGWFGGWFGGGGKASSKSATAKEIEERVQQIMTTEEKQKLYDAIGYEENADTVYPKDFVAVKLQLQLKSLLLKLKDTSLEQQVVANMQFQGFTAEVAQRPAASALRLQAGVGLMKFCGCASSEDADAPVFVTSRGLLTRAEDSQKFVDVVFETNPLDGRCDTRIVMKAQPLEITYHAKTVILLSEFFRPPESIYIMQLQEAAMAKLEVARKQSASALQWSIHRQAVTDINVSFQPTCIIIPDKGCYARDCRMLMIDLGALSIVTEERAKKPDANVGGTLSPTISIDDIKPEAYNKFKAKLTSVQILYAKRGDDWIEARNKQKTNLHLLNPMTLHVDLYQCLVIDPDLARQIAGVAGVLKGKNVRINATYAGLLEPMEDNRTDELHCNRKIRIEGELPSLEINLTDERLSEVLQLLLEIPLPEQPQALEDEDELEKLLKVSDSKLAPIQEDTEDLANLKLPEKNKSDDSAFVNAAEVEAVFEIREMCLNLAIRKENEDLPTLKFVVESLGIQFTNHKFDTRLTAYLGGLHLHHTNCEASVAVAKWCSEIASRCPARKGALPLVTTPAPAEGSARLFSITILLAQRRHPEFTTVYRNTLQRVIAEFSSLQILLHEDALISIAALIQAFQTALENSQPPPPESNLKKRHRSDSSVSLSSISSGIGKLEPHKKRRALVVKKSDVELIKMAIEARLTNLSVAISQRERLLAEIKISGVDVNVMQKRLFTNITASLSNISVLDYYQGTKFPQILYVEGDEFFKVDVVAYNDIPSARKEVELGHADASVKLETGCVKVIFIYRFVGELLQFLNQFEDAKKAMVEASASLADQAADVAHNMSTRAFKLSLDVRMKAPVLIIPESSTSDLAIVVDLGQLTVKNKFEKPESGLKGPEGDVAVIEELTADLTNLKISSAVVTGTTVTAECNILQPVSLQVAIFRNLSSMWYHEHPDVKLRGRLDDLSIALSQSDVKTLFAILSGNLQEFQQSTESVSSSDNEPRGANGEGKHSSPGSGDGHGETAIELVYSILELDFTFEHIQLELFRGNRELTISGHRLSTDSLACFQLQAIKTSLSVQNNKALTCNLSLCRCDLTDTRPERAQAITKMITQSPLVVSGKSDENRPPMIHLVFKQLPNSDRSVDAKVNGLHIVICVEYLMMLKDFVMEGMSTVTIDRTGGSRGESRTAETQTETVSSDSAGTLQVKFSMVKPEIVLVEDSTQSETNAFILSMQADMSLDQTSAQQTVRSTVRGLTIASCVYTASASSSPHKQQMLRPFDIDLHSTAPNGRDHHVGLSISDVIVDISPFHIKMLSTILSTLAVKPVEEEGDHLEKIPKDLWGVKKIDDLGFWFLKSEADEESGLDLLNKDISREQLSVRRDEQFILHECRIVVTLSGITGGRTVPFVYTRMSLTNVQIKNWTSLLGVEAEISLEMASYNDRLSVWEPVIETIETDNGSHRPWELSVKLQQTELAWDEDDVDSSPSLPPPRTALYISSDDVLPLTVTKSALEVQTNLLQSFSNAYQLRDSSLSGDIDAPFVVKNETGFVVTVSPDSHFKVDSNSLIVDAGHTIFLSLKETSEMMPKSQEPLYKSAMDEKPKMLELKVPDLEFRRPLNVSRVAKRSFHISQKFFPGGTWQIVTQVDANLGCKIVTLRSNVQVKNNLSFAVDLLGKLTDDAWAACGSVQPGEVRSMPCDVAYNAPYELYVKPAEDNRLSSYAESSSGCGWKDAATTRDAEILECKAIDSTLPSIFISSKLLVEPIFFESSSILDSKSYMIVLGASVVFRNLLPVDITCLYEGKDIAVSAGCSTELLHACPGKSVFRIKMLYQSRTWEGDISVSKQPQTLSPCVFKTDKNGEIKTMELGLHFELTENGSQQLSLYSPYWMINKTKRDLQYKATDSYIVKHKAADLDNIVFFVLKLSTASSSNNKAALRVDSSEYSQLFSLDTVGSVGTVQCKCKSQTLAVGVTIRLASNSLTKIVTFTPYYMLINQAKFDVECKELNDEADWYAVPSGNCIPFWPIETGVKRMTARICGTKQETRPFFFTESSTTFLKLDHEYGGINVECAVAESAIKVLFQQYFPGFAVALILNQTLSHIDYHQNCGDLSQTPLTLGPQEATYYTWQEPTGQRELVWSCGTSRNNKNDLVQDGIGDFFADNDTKLYWVSFLDGMQRVLLITDDIALATKAQQAGELERIELEVNFSLQGLGLSLVNNLESKEIAYMAISSSGVVWEGKRRKRFTDLEPSLSMLLEDSYQQYLAQVAVNRKVEGVKSYAGGKIEVDFSTNTINLIKPQNIVIQRSFHPGIWMQYGASQQRTHLHFKVHRLQLDSQLPGAIFPTVLAPVPLPKTVAAENAPKPFTEFSVMIRKSVYSDVMQFKYCKLLVQEFSVKIDQSFLNSMLTFFDAALTNRDDEQQRAVFRKECDIAKRNLHDDVDSATAGAVKNFFDELHFSPLKIHLSFSFYGDKGKSAGSQPAIQWAVLSVFLESIGVVLTDVQDVVFKLAYFERKHQFYNQKQLQNEIIGHYKQQAIRQMYVLVLGLDVLGNPFGVIRSLATGIEDLFYEPYQGLIQGPEEFAEGVVLGVKSLFGHAIGGAAGAVSRISGTLGKGIAILTMDDEYQKRRRESRNKRPADIKEGIARSGKDLFMGVVHGVTGIVTQPVEGARQEGGWGFIKGVGKGLVGVIARPASGVVDFASSSFDGIRRWSEMSTEIQKLRPARYIQSDGVIRPYVYRDAEGNQILVDVDGGAFISEQYVTHLMLSNDGRNALVVTDKRAILTTKGDMLGHWDVQWNYTWDQLKEAPAWSEKQKGLLFVLKEKESKDMWPFSGSSSGKVVLVPKKEVADAIASKIKATMQQH